MSAPVFLAPSEEIRDLQLGQHYVLAGDEGYHAAVVQRRGLGEVVEIVDGAGCRVRARVVKAVERKLEVEVAEVVFDNLPRPRITIVQALVKSGAEEAVATLTEVGVHRIVPWQSQRTVAKWRGQRGEKALHRWRISAREAAKQSRRSYIPEVAPGINTRELCNEIAHAVSQGEHVFIAHEEAVIPLVDARATAPCTPAWVVIGPEGGISSEELRVLQEAGGIAVSLGGQVLRAVTAGTVATVLLTALPSDREVQ